MLCMVLMGGGSVMAQKWVRCTQVSDLLSGGVFIIGYEKDAKSGVIVPMRNEGTLTKTKAGYIYSGTTSNQSTSTTIDMSSVSVSETPAYEVVIEPSTVVKDAVTIRIGENFIGNTNTQNNVKLFAEESVNIAFTPSVGSNDVFTLKIDANKTYTHLQYNASSPRFAVYGGTQQNVVLYKRKVVSSVVVSGTPIKTEYQAGEKFNTEGLVVTVNYSDGSYRTADNGVTWSVTPETLTQGLTSVTVKATSDGFESEEYNVTGLTVSAAKTLTKIDVSGTPDEFWKGDAFNHNNITVTATWDDGTQTDVTSESEFSTPEMSTAGPKTVTVTYKEKTTTYNIDVKTIANTQKTAYTVNEAINLIKAGKDLDTEVYVKGVVSKVDSYNSDYKSITYWLDNNTFKVYSGKGLDKADFGDLSGVTLGADVIICGNLKKYDSTYELDEGNYLVSYQASTAALQSVTIERGPSVKTNYLEGESFDKTGLVAYANYNDGSKLDVTSSAKWTITPTDLTASVTQVTVYATFNDTKSAESTIDINVSPAITINLSTADQVTTADADKLEWKLEKLTITAEKYNSQTPTNNYYPKTSGKNYTSTRFYTDSKLTFTPSATIRIDKIIYTATTTSYATAMSGSDWTNALASADDKTVTITPVNGLSPVSAVIGGNTGGTKIVVGYTDLTEFHTRNTATGSYGTVCLPKDAKVVGAKIYNVQTKDNNTIIIKEVADNVLEAGKPYIYKATDGSQTFYCASSDAEKAAGTNGVLVGSYSEADIEKDNGNYILHGDKFYLVNSDNVKVGANRAYIHIVGGTSARMMIVDGNTETGICLPEVDAEDNDGSANVYDLSGRRVADVKSGVYVQNGKLFIK